MTKHAAREMGKPKKAKDVVLQISPEFSPPAVIAVQTSDCGYLSRLLIQSAHGDQNAFTALYDETSGVVYGLALGLLGSHSAADELTKAVYVKIWTQSTTFRPDKIGALTWILTLTRVCVGQQLADPHATAALHEVG